MSTFVAIVIRLFPFIVAGCVLAFPVYKGLLLGYVPVLVGVVGALWMIRWGDRFSLPRPAWQGWLHYGLPVLVQAGLLLIFRPVPMFDGLFVYEQAVTLAQTGVNDPMTYYPPAMAFWFAGWFKLLGASVLVAQFSQIPLSLGVTWLTGSLAKRLSGCDKIAFWAGLAVAWYPSFVGYVLTTPYYHYLYTMLTVGMVATAWRFWALDFGLGIGEENLMQASSATLSIRRSTFNVQYARWLSLLFIFVSGLLAGLGALTKAVQLIAPLQIATWLAVLGIVAWFSSPIVHRPLSLVPRIKPLALFTLGMAVMLLPWMIRNYQVFGEIVPVCTSGGLVLYSANNPDSNGLYSETPDLATIATPSEMLAHSRWCSAQAKQWMMDEPRSFMRLAGIKFLHTWGSEATFTELINWRGEFRRWIKPGFSFVFLAGWSALVTGWCWRSWRLMRARADLSSYEILFGVIVLSNAVVYMVFEGGDRHHLPLVPLIVMYGLGCRFKVEGSRLKQ